MLLDFLKPRFRLRAHLAYPRFHTVLQLRMILVFPSSSSLAQRLALLAALNLLPSNLSEERTPSSLADQLINVGNHINRKNDVRSAV